MATTLETSAAGRSLTRSDIADLLADARARTLLLIAPLAEEDLRRQHDPLMSPMIWDIGHIAEFERLWLIENLKGKVSFGEMPGMYNPFENPRSTRDELPLPPLSEVLDMLAETRRRVLESLGAVDLAGEDPLLRDGYVYRMVVQHEHQHNETMLQTLQLKKGEPYRAPRGIVGGPGRPPEKELVRFPGGVAEIGTEDRTAAYDNERPAHLVELDPFWIDAAPVSNGSFLEFMEAGGYSERRWWSEAGWAWVSEGAVSAPKYWSRDGGEWRVRFMDREAPVPLDHPVCHVCFHEAEAYARWAGKRLPTEQEWEAAACVDPSSGARRAWPWGAERVTARHAHLDQLAFMTAPIGAYPPNVSPIGCVDMIGNVWEWTSSDFLPWPGFETFPYAEYSEVFFGSDYKVLRGGSWATRPGAIRATFRNWDYPIRRQIFAGFRCARDE